MSVNADTEIRAALVQATVNAALGIPVGYENVTFDKPVAPNPWAYAFNLPVNSSPATLGDQGEDEHKGIWQIDLNFPMREGEVAVNLVAGLVRTYFRAGRKFINGSSKVTITSCSRSRGREAEGFWRVSMSINYFARAPRI